MGKSHGFYEYKKPLSLARHIGGKHMEIKIGKVADIEKKCGSDPQLFVKELGRIHLQSHSKGRIVSATELLRSRKKK